jgi:hypothetical protein
MPTDQLVTTSHVLKAVMEVDRRGATKVMSELEKLEPDLAEYVLESLTRFHHRLTGLGLSGRDARRAYRRAEKSVLVSLMALRNAHRELWDKGDGESGLRSNPRSPDSPPTPSPPPPPESS